MGALTGPMTGTTMPGASTGPVDPTRSVVIVIPVEEDLSRETPFYPTKQLHQRFNPGWAKLHLTIRDEKIVTNLFTDSSSIQWYSTLKETPAFLRTYTKDVREAHAKWAKSKADSKAGFNLVVDALRHGMVPEAVQYADELLASAKDRKDNLAEVAAFVRAYGAMQKGINGVPGKRANADYWTVKLDAKNLTPSQHYAILSWDATEEEIARRRTLLEENFKAFFLWHATRGIELPLPEAPLVVAIAKQGRDVIHLARALDAPPRLPADGFFSAEHGVLVLSPERLDSVGLTFSAQIRDMYQGGLNRKELLAGRGPDLDTTLERGKKPDEVARLQTVALVERLVDENAAICAISREGTQQLLYATGQIPKYVALPEWLSNGAVNFFTRPKDPAFVTGPDGKPWMTVASTTGYGAANYVLQRQFKEHYGPLLDERRDRKEVAEQSTQRVLMLKNLLADAYFHGLRDPKDANDPDPVKQDKSGFALSGGTPMGTGTGQPPVGPMGTRPPIGPPGAIGPMTGVPGTGMTDPNAPPPRIRSLSPARSESDSGAKAHATSWALYYYLARDRPAELRAFVAELAALPRDLPLDGATVTAAFCRAFNLEVNNPSFARFADAWMEYMRTVPPAGIDIPLVDPKPPTTTGTPGGMPNPKGPPGIGPPGSIPPNMKN